MDKGLHIKLPWPITDCPVLFADCCIWRSHQDKGYSFRLYSKLWQQITQYYRCHAVPSLTTGRDMVLRWLVMSDLDASWLCQALILAFHAQVSACQALRQVFSATGSAFLGGSADSILMSEPHMDTKAHLKVALASLVAASTSQ